MAEHKPLDLNQIMAYLADQGDGFVPSTLALSKVELRKMPHTPALTFVKGGRPVVVLDPRVLDGRFTVHEAAFILTHEVYHVLLGHLTDRWIHTLVGKGEQDLVLTAMDVALHEVRKPPESLRPTVCTASGLQLPENRTAEIYLDLLRQRPQNPRDGDGGGDEEGGAGKPGDDRSDDRFKPWQGHGKGRGCHCIDPEKSEGGMSQQALDEFIDAVEKHAGTLPSELIRAINGARDLQLLPLIQRVAQLAERSVGGRGVRRSRIVENRRMPDSTWAGKRRTQKFKFAALVDTSGSISSRDLDLFGSQLIGLVTYCDIFVVPCDAEVHDPFWLRSPHLGELKGGGGTVFNEAFQLVEQMGFKTLVVFTDGYCEAPKQTSIKKVVWAIHDHQGEFTWPFGDVVKIRRGS